MNIILNTKMPIIYDFFQVIMFRYNNIDFIENYAGGGLIVDDRVTEALDYIWDGLDTDTPGVTLFFYRNDDRRCFLVTEYDQRLHEFNDVNELIETIFSGPLDELQLSVLRFYDEDKKNDSFYYELISDKEKAYSFISSLKIPVACKWELKGLMDKPEEIIEPFKIFCHRVKRKLRNVYKENSEYIKSFNKEMAVKIKNNSDFLIDSELQCLFKRDFREDDRDIIITYSLINEFLFFHYTTADIRCFILGMKYQDAMKCNNLRDNAKINDAFLKAYSDKQRMRIFRLLMNKEMFVGQIAKELNMILSTTSYHLDILLSARIIEGRPEGKKIYYKVNKELIVTRFLEIVDYIKKGNF